MLLFPKVVQTAAHYHPVMMVGREVLVKLLVAPI